MIGDRSSAAARKVHSGTQDQTGLRPIFVVGPARSGTSAITRAINLMGAPLCNSDDLYAADQNPLGYWESSTVIALNDRLLSELGASEGLPPDPLVTDGPFDRLGGHEEARTAFQAVHPHPGWVCKDPRLCVTLPFWKRALAVDPVLVLVSRAPSSVVASLMKGEHREAHAFALWERYSLWALTNLQGADVALVHFDSVIENPHASCEALGQTLISAGCQAIKPENFPQAAESIASPRHDSGTRLPCESLAHRHIWDLLQAQPRWSSPWSCKVPEESAATTELLEAIAGTRWLDSKRAALMSDVTLLSSQLQAATAGRPLARLLHRLQRVLLRLHRRRLRSRR